MATQNGPLTRYYAFDVRGNLATRTDSAGAVTERPLSTASSGETIQGETTSTFAGQAGGYFDAETGLILFGARYYDPSSSTWITRDPIAEAGGINLYAYVQGNPTNATDGSGLSQGSVTIDMEDLRALVSEDLYKGTLLGNPNQNPIPTGEPEDEIKLAQAVHCQFGRAGAGCLETGLNIEMSVVPGGGGESEAGAASRVETNSANWIDEGTPASQNALDYQSWATGARHNIITDKSQAAALDYTNAEGMVAQVRFDGEEGDILIDRKFGINTGSKTVNAARRQSLALQQNNKMGRWEVPTARTASRASRVLKKAGVSNITVIVVPVPK